VKIEEIFELWDKDVKFDLEALDTESAKIAPLHSKYYKLYAAQQKKLRQATMSFEKLETEKREFYIQGPTPEQHEKGWRLPPCGKILRS
jgi:predicted  nucleic acid-binding Zn-ribbon protein